VKSIDLSWRLGSVESFTHLTLRTFLDWHIKSKMCGFLCVMFDYYLDFLQAKKSGKTSWFSVTLLPMEGFPLKEIIHPLASPVICPPWSYPYSRWLSSNNIKQSMHFWCSQVTSGSFVIGKSLFCFIDSSTFFLVVRDLVWMHFHHLLLLVAVSYVKICVVIS
jgi:hypothetical protein